MTASGPSGLPHPAEVVEAALAAADGPCIVLVEEAHGVDVRYANNSATTDGVRLDRKVTAVRVVERDGEVLSGVARQSGDVDVAALVAEAAWTAQAADDAAPLIGGTAASDFDADPQTADLSVLDPVLDGLPHAFRRAEEAGTVLSGFCDHHAVTTYLGSTTGLRRRYAQPTGSLQLVGRRDGRSAWAGVGTADFAGHGLEPLEEQVARGLDWAATTIDVPAGRHEVVLPPSAVGDLMLFLLDATGGREAEEGRTVFSRAGGGTRIGEVLTAMPFELWSDPEAQGLECTPFLATGASTADLSVFDNGMALERTHWIREGRLERLQYHRAGAARSGALPTAPVDNLLLRLPGATGSLEDMVAGTERGLLVTCLWYIREVDPRTLLLTGLTRDGVYVVEDGRVVGAANNFRFNESPVDVLSRASEASATVRTLGREGGSWLNRMAMPALRIPDFNMSTVSQAV
jgi:predicted Zn-dependent protease